MNPLIQETLRLVVPFLIVTAGVGGFAVLSNQQQASPRSEVQELAPLVETVPVQLRDSGLDIEVDGVVVPFREVTLSAEVAGRVLEKSAALRAGRTVTKDTPLLQIDPRTYQFEVDRLQQELQQADATIQELVVEAESTQSLLELAEQQVALAEKQSRRVQDLFSRQVSTERELDETRSAELTARNTSVTLRNQLNLLNTRRNRLEQGKKLAQAKLDQAELDLSRTQIVAPLDGVIVSELVEQDQYVQPGTQLVTLEDTSAVEVRCQLRMEELQWLWQQAGQTGLGQANQNDPYALPQTPATVIYRLGDQEYSWRGVVTRYDGVGLDERTRTVPCRVLVPEPASVHASSPQMRASGPPALVRGMYVTVKVHTQPGIRLLQLPDRALRPGSKVWKYDNGRLQIVDVLVAQILDDTVLFNPEHSELAAQDQVIITPLVAATDGMPVRLESAQTESPPKIAP